MDILEPTYDTIGEEKGSRAMDSGKTVSGTFYVK